MQVPKSVSEPVPVAPLVTNFEDDVKEYNEKLNEGVDNKRQSILLQTINTISGLSSTWPSIAIICRDLGSFSLLFKAAPIFLESS